MKKRTYIIIGILIFILGMIAQYIMANQPLNKQEKVTFQKIAWNSLDPYEKYITKANWKHGKISYIRAGQQQYIWDKKSIKYRFNKVVSVWYKVPNSPSVGGDITILIDRQTKEIVGHGFGEG